MCTASSFDASFDCKGTFVLDILPKIVKRIFPPLFVDSSKNFFSGRANNNSELSFVTPAGLPVKAVESISG